MAHAPLPAGSGPDGTAGTHRSFLPGFRRDSFFADPVSGFPRIAGRPAAWSPGIPTAAVRIPGDVAATDPVRARPAVPAPLRFR